MEAIKISKNTALKIITLISIIGLLSITIMASPASALISQNAKSWQWTSDTNVSSIATGDVNGDGKSEIVTGGYYSDGTRYNAQLTVWNASNMAVLNVASWYWTSNTQISSVAIGDVNGDGQNEIVTGGSYFDGTRWNAQLAVWNGATLALEMVKGWFWTSDTQISTIALANITHTTGLDIVTGGGYNDNVKWNAQLCVWSGPTLTLEKVMGWAWGPTTLISSVATGDVTGAGSISIATAGSYFDGTRWNAQLAIWNGTTLALNNVFSWYWTSDTEVNSITFVNVTGGTALSLVAGGDYNDGTRFNSQLTSWDASTLVLQNVYSWYTNFNTKINSVAVGNFSRGPNIDIITAGTYFDGVHNNAQLIDYTGLAFTRNSATNWITISDTEANAVAIGDFGLGNRVAVGGSFFDNTFVNAQLTIWT